jgi:hypothetical protein
VYVMHAGDPARVGSGYVSLLGGCDSVPCAVGWQVAYTAWWGGHMRSCPAGLRVPVVFAGRIVLSHARPVQICAAATGLSRTSFVPDTLAAESAQACFAVPGWKAPVVHGMYLFARAWVLHLFVVNCCCSSTVDLQ